MDFRAIRLDWVRGTAEVEVADGKGVRTVLLEGDAFRRVTQTAAPLVRAVVGEVRPRRPDPEGTPSDADFWTALYRDDGDGWELGRPTPPIERWLRNSRVADVRTLVVGCGRGHEARLFARAGAQVVAVDFSEVAIAEAERLTRRDENLTLSFRCRDLFDLVSEPERYDLIVEHCCFCAIEPRRRDEYVEVMSNLLVGGSRLVGLFYSHGREGGPPFSVSEEELRRLFSGGGKFRAHSFERPADSVAARLDQEILAEFHKT